MDPLANTQEQVSLARLLQEQYDQGDALDADDVGRLCELVLALAAWRARGGFCPSEQDPPRTTAAGNATGS